MNGNYENEQPAPPPVIPPSTLPPSNMPPPMSMPPPEQPSTWHKAIGIIMIVFGSIGVLSGCWGIATTFFMDFLAQMMPANQRQMFDMIEDQKAWIIISSVLVLVLETTLIILGIGLLKRRLWAARKYVFWAVPKIILVLVQSVYQYKMGLAQMENFSQQTPNMPAVGSGFMEGLSIITVLLSVLWGCALPVFLLIWFNREKIRTETATWT